MCLYDWEMVDVLWYISTFRAISYSSPVHEDLSVSNVEYEVGSTMVAPRDFIVLIAFSKRWMVVGSTCLRIWRGI